MSRKKESEMTKQDPADLSLTEFVFSIFFSFPRIIHYINMYCPAARVQNSYTNNPASAPYFSNNMFDN